MGVPMIRLSFGRHRGKRLDEVPTTYLVWLVKLPDLSPEVRDTIRCFLYDDDQRDISDDLLGHE